MYIARAPSYFYTFLALSYLDIFHRFSKINYDWFNRFRNNNLFSGSRWVQKFVPALSLRPMINRARIFIYLKLFFPLIFSRFEKKNSRNRQVRLLTPRTIWVVSSIVMLLPINDSSVFFNRHVSRRLNELQKKTSRQRSTWVRAIALFSERFLPMRQVAFRSLSVRDRTRASVS